VRTKTADYGRLNPRTHGTRRGQPCGRRTRRPHTHTTEPAGGSPLAAAPDAPTHGPAGGSPAAAAPDAPTHTTRGPPGAATRPPRQTSPRAPQQFCDGGSSQNLVHLLPQRAPLRSPRGRSYPRRPPLHSGSSTFQVQATQVEEPARQLRTGLTDELKAAPPRPPADAPHADCCPSFGWRGEAPAALQAGGPTQF
jgi:hypothetical protein